MAEGRETWRIICWLIVGCIRRDGIHSFLNQFHVNRLLISPISLFDTSFRILMLALRSKGPSKRGNHKVVPCWNANPCNVRIRKRMHYGIIACTLPVGSSTSSTRKVLYVWWWEDSGKICLLLGSDLPCFWYLLSNANNSGWDVDYLVRKAGLENIRGQWFVCLHDSTMERRDWTTFFNYF